MASGSNPAHIIYAFPFIIEYNGHCEMHMKQQKESRFGPYFEREGEPLFPQWVIATKTDRVA